MIDVVPVQAFALRWIARCVAPRGVVIKAQRREVTNLEILRVYQQPGRVPHIVVERQMAAYHVRQLACAKLIFSVLTKDHAVLVVAAKIYVRDLWVVG